MRHARPLCLLLLACTPSSGPAGAPPPRAGSGAPAGSGGAPTAAGGSGGMAGPGASIAPGIDAAPSSIGGPVRLPLVVTEHFPDRGWFGDASIVPYFKPGLIIEVVGGGLC